MCEGELNNAAPAGNPQAGPATAIESVPSPAAPAPESLPHPLVPTQDSIPGVGAAQPLPPHAAPHALPDPAAAAPRFSLAPVGEEGSGVHLTGGLSALQDLQSAVQMVTVPPVAAPPPGTSPPSLPEEQQRPGDATAAVGLPPGGPPPGLELGGVGRGSGGVPPPAAGSAGAARKEPSGEDSLDGLEKDPLNRESKQIGTLLAALDSKAALKRGQAKKKTARAAGPGSKADGGPVWGSSGPATAERVSPSSPGP